MSKQLAVIILTTIILFPAYMVILSMAAYVGKVWAIRLIFNKNKRSEFHGKEER
jgi:hypothetical protein